MQKTGPSTQTQISLLRGQSHFALLRRGTVIGLAHGTVSINSRVHLEHATLAVQTSVQQGGVYCVPTSGWFEIAAQGDVALWLVSPESLFQMASLSSWVGRLLKRFTVKPGLSSGRTAQGVSPRLKAGFDKTQGLPASRTEIIRMPRSDYQIARTRSLPG